MGADPVRGFDLPAILADGKLGRRQAIMRPPFVPSGFGMSSFRVRHTVSTLWLMNPEILQGREPGIDFRDRALAGIPVQVFSATLT
jgi:hypothetical protein